ncbi:MAG: hypothetical protein V1858_05520 [Candidatus Gottesmanbacteria bacterium]
MYESSYHFVEKGLKVKIRAFLEDLWPVVYRNINGFLEGLIDFIKNLILSPFKRY